MILGYSKIVELINTKKLLEGANPDNINAASVDLTLSPRGLVEDNSCFTTTIDLAKKERMPLRPVSLEPAFYLRPGYMIICATQEIFNIPGDIAAEFRLKSSASRNGLNLCLGLHCDPGWYGSALSFTLINQTQRTTIGLRPGMKIGQAIFRLVAGEIPETKTYAATGQYNNDRTVTASKGIR